MTTDTLVLDPPAAASASALDAVDPLIKDLDAIKLIITESPRQFTTRTPSRFLALPRETRNQIYAHAFAGQLEFSSDWWGTGPRSVPNHCVDLLFTCRQIHDEALPYLYDRIFLYDCTRAWRFISRANTRAIRSIRYLTVHLALDRSCYLNQSWTDLLLCMISEGMCLKKLKIRFSFDWAYRSIDARGQFHNYVQRPLIDALDALGHCRVVKLSGQDISCVERLGDELSERWTLDTMGGMDEDGNYSVTLHNSHYLDEYTRGRRINAAIDNGQWTEEERIDPDCESFIAWDDADLSVYRRWRAEGLGKDATEIENDRRNKGERQLVVLAAEYDWSSDSW